ncbi:MAG: hypothetical protein QF898_08085 [SAR202 cluster bacterium]|nr:hypothetical protein [SAR202 cluster bacterium]
MANQQTINASLSSHLSGADVSPALRELLHNRNVEESLKTVSIAASGGDESLRPSQLALIVRYLLENESDTSARDKKLTLEELTLCCGMAASIVSSPDSAFGVKVSDSAWSMAHRIAYQQFPDQEESSYVPRSLAIYRQIAPTLVEEGGFDLERSYHEAYGLTIDEAWKIGHALTQWSISNPGKVFNPETLTQQLGLKDIHQEHYKNFLATQSCTYDVYRSMLSAPTEGQPHFEPYNLNPFRKFPILTLPDGNHILPMPGYLLRRITHGLYYDLIELDRSGYISLIGRTFKNYAGKLLESLPSDTVSRLDNDVWTISNNDTTILIECITRPFGAMSRSTGDRVHLHTDLSRRGGVVDSVKRIQDFQESAAGGSAPNATIQGNQTVGVVVALEDFYLANGPFIRSVVNEELENQGRNVMGPDIQLTHVAGLEAACALAAASNRSLAEVMSRKVNQSSYQGLELDAYIRHLALIAEGDGTSLVPELLKSVAAALL